MKDWSQYAKTVKDSHQTGGAEPKISSYLAIKFVDNLLPLSVFILTMVFSIIALFVIDTENQQKLNWALHAAELCLGVFLGLLKGSHKQS